MIIPLGLFFTHHPSKYFPLAAIAGCNDVRINEDLPDCKTAGLLRPSSSVDSFSSPRGGSLGSAADGVGYLHTHCQSFEQLPV